MVNIKVDTTRLTEIFCVCSIVIKNNIAPKTAIIVNIVCSSPVMLADGCSIGSNEHAYLTSAGFEALVYDTFVRA